MQVRCHLQGEEAEELVSLLRPHGVRVGTTAPFNSFGLCVPMEATVVMTGIYCRICASSASYHLCDARSVFSYADMSL